MRSRPYSNTVCRHLLLPALGMLALAASVAAQTGPGPVIKAYYAKQDALMIHKDMTGLAKLWTATSTPDFVNIGKPDAAGKTTKKSLNDQIAEMNQVMPHVGAIPKCASHVSAMSIVGGTAVVTVVTDVTIQFAKIAGQNQIPNMRDLSTSKHTWVKVGTVWKMKKSQTIEDKASQG